MKHDNQIKKLVKILTVLAGISVIVCIVSIAIYVNKNNRSADELLDLGQSYLEDGKYEQAVTSLEAILNIDPKEAKTEEERKVLEDKDAIAEQLTDAYLAWADDEAAKGNGKKADKILADAYEKTGNKNLRIVLKDDDVYSYIGKWNELVNDFGLTESDDIDYASAESEDGNLTVNWGEEESWSDGIFWVYEQEKPLIPIFGFQIGDKKADVRQKIKAIEAKYNAWNYMGEDYEGDETEKVLLCDGGQEDYYLLTVTYKNNKIYKLSLNNEVGRYEEAAYLFAAVHAQKIYGRISHNSWGATYIDYIIDRYSKNLSDGYEEDWKYSLIYVNDDEIPEMYLHGNSTAQGDMAVTTDGKSVDEEFFYDFGGSYIEKENLIRDSGGHMDVYYDRIYAIKNGKFHKVAFGDFGAEDNSNVQVDNDGNMIYEYYWNENEVSEKEYDASLKQVFDTDRAQNTYNQAQYNYSEIIDQIVRLNVMEKNSGKESQQAKNIREIQDVYGETEKHIEEMTMETRRNRDYYYRNGEIKKIVPEYGTAYEGTRYEEDGLYGVEFYYDAGQPVLIDVSGFQYWDGGFTNWTERFYIKSGKVIRYITAYSGEIRDYPEGVNAEEIEETSFKYIVGLAEEELEQAEDAESEEVEEFDEEEADVIDEMESNIIGDTDQSLFSFPKSRLTMDEAYEKLKAFYAEEGEYSPSRVSAMEIEGIYFFPLNLPQVGWMRSVYVDPETHRAVEMNPSTGETVRDWYLD